MINFLKRYWKRVYGRELSEVGVIEEYGRMKRLMVEDEAGFVEIIVTEFRGIFKVWSEVKS